MSDSLSCSRVRAHEFPASTAHGLVGVGKTTAFWVKTTGLWVMCVCCTTFAANAESVLSIATLERTSAVDFATEIAPILKRSCVGCHQQADAEGGLVLESHASLMKGGDSGPAVIAEDAEASLLLMRATGEEEPLMPPEDNDVGASPLTPEELGLWQLWIQQGAHGSDAGDSALLTWQSIPESMRAVYAMDVSPDGQQLAFARGNRLFVAAIDTPNKPVVLADSKLGDLGIADVDLIQSVAFSPDGRRLASGGFRTVRIWKRTNAPLSQANAAWMKPAQLMSVHPDGSAVALVNAIGDIEVWDVAANKRVALISGNPNPVIALAWAGSTGNLVVADGAGRVHIHDTKNGSETAAIELHASLDELTTCSDGVHAALRSSSGIVQLLRFVAAADNAEARIEVVHPSISDISDATAIALIEKPALTVAIATESRGVVLIDATTNQPTRTLDAGAIVDAMVVSTDQMSLVTGSRDSSVVVWSLADGNQLAVNNASVDDALATLKAARDANRQKTFLDRLTAKTNELQGLLKKEDEALAALIKLRDAAIVANTANEEKRVAAANVVAATQATVAKTTAAVTAAEQVLEKAKTKLEKASEDLETQQTAVDQAALVDAKEVATGEPAENDEVATAKQTEAAKQIAEMQMAVEQAQAEVTAAEMQITSGKAILEKTAKEVEAQLAALKPIEAEKAKSEAELLKQQRLTDAAAAAQQRATNVIPEHQLIVNAETRRLARLDAKAARVKSNLTRPELAVRGVTISPDATRIATIHRDGSSRVIHVSDGQSLNDIPPSSSEDQGRSSGNEQFSVTLIGENLCRLTGPGTVQCWPLQDHWTLEQTIGAIDDPNQITDRVTAIDFRPDSMTIAIGSGAPSRSGTAKIFDVHTGELVRDLGNLHSDTTLALAFSPDGRMLASSSADRTIALTDVASGKTTRRLEGHTHHVLSIAWQDNGSVISSAGADQTIKIWNTKTGEASQTVGGFKKEITGIQFVEATDQLVATCGSGEAQLVNSTSAAKIRSYDAAKDFLFSIAITPDGKQLIAGGQSGVVRIWNIADGKLIAESK